MFLRLLVLFFIICMVYGLSKACSNGGSKHQLVCTLPGQNPPDWFAGAIKINSSDKFSITSKSYPSGSILYIHNISIEDENEYTCREHNSGEIIANFTVLVSPSKSFQDDEKIITTVYNGSALEIDCGVLLGRQSRSCYHSFMLQYGDDLSEADDYTGNVTYTSVGEAWRPSLIVQSQDYKNFRCKFSYDTSCSQCSFPSTSGPLYKILYPPVIQITGIHANGSTLVEGSSVDLYCNALEQNNASDLANYTIHWTIRDGITNEIVNEITQDNLLHLTLTTDVMVTCSAQGRVHGHELKSSASINLTVAPNLLKKNIHISMESCDNIIIQLNNSTEAFTSDVHVSVNNMTTIIEKGSSKKTVKLDEAVMNDEVILSMFSVVNGVKGNVYTRSIPTCNRSLITVFLNHSLCTREQTKQEIKGTIEIFLMDVADRCESEVCPKFNDHNWRIVSVDDCTVAIEFDGLPIDELRNAILLVCRTADQCRILDVSVQVDPPTDPPPPGMLDWVLLSVYISFPILVLLVVVLLVCIFYKLIKNRRKKKVDVEQAKPKTNDSASELVESQAPTNIRDNVSSTTTTNTAPVVSCTCTCGRSIASSEVPSIAPPLPDHHQSHSHKHTDPPTTISLNITVNDLPQPLITLFNELGAIESENRTRSSVDTGLGTVGSLENYSDGQSRKQISHKSSGYYGSSAAEYCVINDPNILNPHGRTGFHTHQTECTNTVTETIL